MSRPVGFRTSGRSRSSGVPRAVLLASLMTGCLAPLAVAAPALAVEVGESPNLLDHPRIDAAELQATGPDGAPRILVVDPLDPAGHSVRMSILARDGTWSSVATATVDVAVAGAEDPGEPWLIGLGGDRFVLIASSDAAERTVVVPIDAREEDGAASIVLGPAVQVDAPIDDAGAADVDGDGVLDLVVANARTLRQGGTCQGSTIWVFGDGDLNRRSAFAIQDFSLAAGVLGAFDDLPGEDLAVYAYPNCPAGPDLGTDLRSLSINLVDGSIRSDRLAASAGIPPSMAPPVRFDADGDGRDELLGLLPRGLAVIDPLDGWADIRVASSAAMPLGTTAVTDPAGEPRTRVAWLEPAIEGRGSIGTELVRREAAGSLDTVPGTVRWDASTPSDRWRALLADATIGTLRHAGPVAWSGVLDDPSCRDLLVPTAMVACGSDSVAPSAAWVGTQPLFAFDSRAGRRLLVAAGIEREFGSGLPASPRPWAGGAAGRWRHGPGPGFALAEVDVAGLADSVVPTPVVDRAASRGPAAVIGTRVGVRLVATAFPRGPDALDPTPGTLMGAVRQLAPTSNGTSSLLRVVVPTGVASSAQGGVVELSLDGLTMTDGTPAERWAVFVVALDDSGDVAAPVATLVTQDVVGPAVELAAPVTSPVWPQPARLVGTVEVGATVTVEGAAIVAMGERGSFAIETPLAPWPQTLRVVATDQAGNATVLDVTVIGGFDYRILPWPAILAVAVLAAAMLSGVVGSRRHRAGATGTRSGPVGLDGPMPELEDLPPRPGA